MATAAKMTKKELGKIPLVNNNKKEIHSAINPCQKEEKKEGRHHEQVYQRVSRKFKKHLTLFFYAQNLLFSISRYHLLHLKYAIVSNRKSSRTRPYTKPYPIGTSIL